MGEKAPFFFLFISAIIGALSSSFFQIKWIGILFCLAAVVWFFFLKARINILLAFSIFLIGFVWIETPWGFPNGNFFLVGKVRSISNKVVKLSNVHFHQGNEWVKGRDTYVFLKKYGNADNPSIQNTFMALVENEEGMLKAKEAFWVGFDTALEKLYAWGSKLSEFLYGEMKKYVFSEADTVASMFLGRKDVSYEVRQTYKNGGYAHIFAVSGMHVGFLSFLTLLFISEFLPWNFLKYPLTFFVVLLYGFITGFSTPTIRATAIFGLYVLFKLIDRPQNFLNILGLVGLIEILLDPSLVFDVSFQLSYSAVTSIAVLFPILPKFRPKMLSDSLNMTIAANIGVIPFLILDYGKIYLASFVFNVTIVPILVAILLEGAFLFSVFAFLKIHFIEKILGGGMYPFAKLLDNVADLTKRMPLSALSVKPKVAFFLLTLSSVVLLLLWFSLPSLKPGILGRCRRNSTDDLES